MHSPPLSLCSILMGIAGNLATGAIVGSTGSFREVFAVTAALYVTSAGESNLAAGVVDVADPINPRSCVSVVYGWESDPVWSS